MTPAEIKDLAHLARIEVTDEEVAGYAKDFEAILEYVKQIDEVPTETIQQKFLETNKARSDEHPHPSGAFAEELLGAAPNAQDGFYKVPKIL